MMEWGSSTGGKEVMEGGGGGGYQPGYGYDDEVAAATANIMTEEQILILQKQISIYITLSEQLADMYYAAAHLQATAHYGSTSTSTAPGLVNLGAALYAGGGDHRAIPLAPAPGARARGVVANGGGRHPIPLAPAPGAGARGVVANAGGGDNRRYTPPTSSRQRWTPTQRQVAILERIFTEQGYGTPSKESIEAITAELAQHGQISMTNVYNWFQNRRARWRRRQQQQQSSAAAAAPAPAPAAVNATVYASAAACLLPNNNMYSSSSGTGNADHQSLAAPLMTMNYHEEEMMNTTHNEGNVVVDDGTTMFQDDVDVPSHDWSDMMNLYDDSCCFIDDLIAEPQPKPKPRV